jgi:hypothetical protein
MNMPVHITPIRCDILMLYPFSDCSVDPCPWWLAREYKHCVRGSASQSRAFAMRSFNLISG